VALLAGILLGSLIFPRVADVSGRKVVFYLGVFMHAILIGVILIVKQAQWFLAILFLMGIEHTARYLIGYIYISEFCLEKHRPLVTSILLFLYAQAETLCALYFYFLDWGWIYFELLGLGMAILCLPSAFFIPESPRWLIASQQYKKLLTAYKKIAKFNGEIFSAMIFKLNRRTSEKQAI
jgi:MFS family permease